MRRKSEGAAPAQVPTNPVFEPPKPGDPPPPPGAVDWTAPPGLPAQSVATKPIQSIAELQQAVSAGDTMTVTMGRTTLSPEKYNTFDIGPLSMTVSVRQDETAAQAYTRARAALEHLYEAEVELRTAEFKEHLQRVRVAVKA